MNSERCPQILGFPLAGGVAASTTGLSAAATWLAFSKMGDGSGNLNGIWVYCVTVAGTLGLISVSVEVQGDAAGVPDGATIASGTASFSVGAFPGVGWVHFAGLNCANVFGTRYWVVLKNLSALPATNYPAFRFASNNVQWNPNANGQATIGGSLTKALTTTSGGSWTSFVASVWGIRFDHAGSNYDGAPIENGGGSVAFIYSNIEAGVKFTVPIKCTVYGLGFYITAVGTPTGLLRFRLYSGASVYTTATGPGVNPNSQLTLYFSAGIELDVGDIIRCVVSETTQSDTSSNRFTLGTLTVHNDANSKSLLPMNGTLQLTQTADATASPVVWTDTDTYIAGFALILKPGVPFPVPTFPATTDVRDTITYGYPADYTGSLIPSAGGGGFTRIARYGRRKIGVQ